MKRIRLLLVLIAITFSLSAVAESDGTTITISSNIALPVLVKPNGGSSFSLYQRSYTTSTRIADARFYDAQGNLCMVRHSTSHSGGNVHHYYSITGVYSSSSYSSSSDDYSSSSSGSSLSSSYAEAGQNLAESIVTGMSIPCEGHPFLAIGLGISKSCGEFARLKFVTGGVAGLVISGSIGQDWIFCEEYADKISWNAGLGFRFGDPNTDIGLNVLIGHTPWHPDMALMMNLECEHFFGKAKRFGVFGNIGFAATNLDDKGKVYFDFMVGCSVKLWQK